jgi:hypothetical protein
MAGQSDVRARVAAAMPVSRIAARSSLTCEAMCVDSWRQHTLADSMRLVIHKYIVNQTIKSQT